ncbi:hypothetical protein VTN96DRAFT_4 [Rasamsonia emersonii]
MREDNQKKGWRKTRGMLTELEGNDETLTDVNWRYGSLLVRQLRIHRTEVGGDGKLQCISRDSASPYRPTSHQ